MRMAFEERISGRAPEQRGNGLKFVRKGIDGEKQRLFCLSGDAIYKKGNFTFDFDLKALEDAPGTLSAVEWDCL